MDTDATRQASTFIDPTPAVTPPPVPAVTPLSVATAVPAAVQTSLTVEVEELVGMGFQAAVASEALRRCSG